MFSLRLFLCSFCTGATGALNSVLSALFMTPEFRNGLLASELDFAGVPKKYSLLFQLQVLFSRMLLGAEHEPDAVVDV